MEVAVVGAPSTGKSLALQAMGAKASDAGGRKGSGRLVVSVPDARIDHLSSLYQPKKTTFATIEFREAGGLGLGEQGGAMGGEFRNQIQGAEALVVVVRDFELFGEAPDVRKSAQAILEEMHTLDYVLASSRLEKMEESRKKAKPVDALEEAALKEVVGLLEAGTPLFGGLSAESLEKLRGYAFLGLKPIVVLLNTEEPRATSPLPAGVPFDKVPTFRACLPLEAEIAELETAEERAQFLSDLGIGEPVLHKVIRHLYAALDLIPFFTVGEDEVRAWTIRRGTVARAAAGAIHSDLERGFIAAEVCAYDDLKALGDYKACKAHGKVRVESRDYVVRDGDIINVRFNV
jgi:ribosome-binding ATPase YchF (GTP1/OBG family)